MIPLRSMAPFAALLTPWVFVASCCAAAPPEASVPATAEPPSPAELASIASPLGGAGEASATTPRAPPTAGAAGSAPAVASAAVTAAPSTAPTVAPNAVRQTLLGTVTNAAGKPVQFGVVYLEDGPREAGRGDKASVYQKNMMFLPYVSVVSVGGSVTWGNGDPFPHNVYTADGERFNMGMVSAASARARTFKQPGAYHILCNLHPGMQAWVFVAPSSFFAVSDGKGSYAIKDVPEGTYKVAAWVSGAPTETQTVVVKGGDATANFTVKK